MLPFKYSLIPYTNTIAGEEIIFSPAIVVKKMCNYIHNGKNPHEFRRDKIFLGNAGRICQRNLQGLKNVIRND